MRLKTRLSGDDAVVDTVTPVYPAAGWPEREVFDLFGVTFRDHPDLRRILMPEDWQGYPLRRDYPVQGVDYVLTNAYRRLSERSYEITVRVDGREVAVATAVVSPDGSRLTVDTVERDAAGAPRRTTAVYTRR